MIEFKVGDKVKVKNNINIWDIIQINGKIVFLSVGSGALYPILLSDLEKVEEKVAPPKYTKVFVWDGKRPKHPKMEYSFGELDDNGNLRCFSRGEGEDYDGYWDNWEVIE